LLSNLPDDKWKRIDKLAFPGCLSNHHLFTLPPPWSPPTMIEFGQVCAKQVVANAQASEALDAAGFDVR
jgi:hypothetical protein